MTDFIVSRIQNRRGNQVDLPQPLRPGELGWCLDTGRLFIGADPEITGAASPGIQVYAGQISSAQSIITNQIIQVSYTAGFNFVNFQAYMDQVLTLPLTAVGNSYVVQGYDSGAGTGNVFVGLTLAQSAHLAGYLTYINAFGNCTSAAASYTVASDGTITLSAHADANAISYLLNYLGSVSTGISNTNLNVEISVKTNDDINNILYDLSSFNLNTGGSFSTLMTYDASIADAIVLEYSAHYNDAVGNYYQSIGDMMISGIATNTIATGTYSTNSSSVLSTTLTNGGTGYAGNFTFTVTTPLGTPAVLRYSTDALSAITVTVVSGGSGYPGSSFTVNVTDAGTGTFVITATVVAGIVTVASAGSLSGTINPNQTNINVTGGVGTVPTPGGGTFTLNATVVSGVITVISATGPTGSISPSLSTIALNFPDTNSCAFQNNYSEVAQGSMSSGVLQFKAIPSGGDILLQYKNTKANTIKFKLLTRRWLSF
jgi:hypothetical protein